MSKPRILVIDDDAHFRETARLTLDPEGYEVVTAGSAEEGIRRFADGVGRDLVLLDYRLGDIEGDVVAHRLHYLTGGVPVL